MLIHGTQELPDLIGLGHAVGILEIEEDRRVRLPVDVVAPLGSEEHETDRLHKPPEVGEADVGEIAAAEPGEEERGSHPGQGMPRLRHPRGHLPGQMSRVARHPGGSR